MLGVGFSDFLHENWAVIAVEKQFDFYVFIEAL